MTTTDPWRWKDRYAADDLEVVICHVCGANQTSHIATEFSLNIVRCNSCGLIYVNPRPRDSEKNYWASSRVAVEKKYAAIFEGQKPHDRDRLYTGHLGLIARYQPKGRFLDIGTHCGFFLRHTIGRGWEAEGVEPSPVLSELAREKFGLNVRTGLLNEAAFPNDTFDVITLLDVIEHLQNPAGLLTEARRIIRPGGVFFIKTPNGTYNYFKHLIFRRLLRRSNYDCFNAREHIAAYTIPTLSRLLSKNGWRVFASMPAAPVQTYGSGLVKVAGREVLYTLSRLQHTLTRQPGPLATDIIVLAQKA